MSSEIDARRLLTSEKRAAQRQALSSEQQTAVEELRRQVRLQREPHQVEVPDWDTAAGELAKALRSRPLRRRVRAGLPADLADLLNRFLRLKSDAETEAFRQNWPHFFPPIFWRYFIRIAPDGPVLTLDTASAEAVERLKQQPAIPLWRAWQQLLRVAWDTSFDLDSTAQLLNINLPDEHAFNALPAMELSGRNFEFVPAWDFQRAVLGVALGNWRAHFCGRCGQPFVAERPKNKYCSVACSSEVIGNRKVIYWRRNRKRLNAKRRRKYLADHPRKKA